MQTIIIKKEKINYGKQFILFEFIFFAIIVYDLLFKRLQEHYNFYILLKQIILLSLFMSIFLLLYLFFLKKRLISSLYNGRLQFYNHVLYTFNFIAIILIINSLGLYIETLQTHVFYYIILNILLQYFLINFAIKSLLYSYYVFFKQYSFKNKKIFTKINYILLGLLIIPFFIINNSVNIAYYIVILNIITTFITFILSLILYIYNFFNKQYILVANWSMFIMIISFTLFIKKITFFISRIIYERIAFSFHALFIINSIIIISTFYLLVKFKDKDNEIEF